MMGALWRDGAVYALGTIVSRGLGLLLLPLYTRALAPGPFGLLDLIVTAGVLVNLVVPLETPQAVARLWNERAPGAPRRLLAGTGFTFALAGYAVFLVLAWLLAEPLARALGGEAGVEQVAAVRAGAVFIAANGLMLALQSQFRWALRPRAYTAVAVGYALGVLAGMALLVATGTASVASVLWLQAAVAAAAALACGVALARDIAWRLDGAELRRMLAFSLPLVPAGVAVFVTVYLHRFVLASLGTLADVGLFAIASRVAALATLVLIGVQSALTPLVYAHHAEPGTPARLARLLEAFWAVALLACAALALFGRELLALLAAPAYADAAPLVLWLAPAALLAQMYIFAPGIPLAKKTGWQLALTLASGAIGLALALLLVPRWQATGAAVAAWVASAVFFAAWLAAGQRLYRLPLRWAPLAIATGGFAVLTVGAMQRWGVAIEPGAPTGAAGAAMDAASVAASLAARGALWLALAVLLWLVGLLRRSAVMPGLDGSAGQAGGAGGSRAAGGTAAAERAREN